MPTYQPKPRRFEGYQFSGDDKVPGCPVEWLATGAAFSGVEGDKQITLEKSGGSQVAKRGDFILRNAKTAEVFFLSAESVGRLFEEV